MKHSYMVPALVLALVFAMAVTAPAGVIRGEGVNNPGLTGGGEGDDGDHPWGGDQITDGGGIAAKQTYRLAIVTGYPAIDIFVNSLLIGATIETAVSQPKSTVQTAAQSGGAGSGYRPEKASFSARNRLLREAR
ncbi:MAG: hypothetical protein AB1772_01700 [Candidatus Zixiibacteriota bacterium]